MWTFVLGGNLHLSITMTCISTIASFGNCDMHYLISSFWCRLSFHWLASGYLNLNTCKSHFTECLIVSYLEKRTCFVIFQLLMSWVVVEQLDKF